GRPIAKSHESPVAGIAHDLGPGLLARERLAADMARDDGVRPHRYARVEILEAMGAQPHALGLEGGCGPRGQRDIWHERHPSGNSRRGALPRSTKTTAF